MGKKIAIIGSSQYMQEKMIPLKEKLEKEGHEVRVPALDRIPELDEIGVCNYNLEIIKWSDIVYVLWDQRSIGTIFDFGMAFALRKPIKIEYLNPKTFTGLMKKYEQLMSREEKP